MNKITKTIFVFAFVVGFLGFGSLYASAALNQWIDTTGPGYGNGDLPLVHPYSANDNLYGPISPHETDTSFLGGNPITNCLFGMMELVSKDGVVYFVRPTDGTRIIYESVQGAGLNCDLATYGTATNIWSWDPALGGITEMAAWNLLAPSYLDPVPLGGLAISTNKDSMFNEALAVGAGVPGAPMISGFAGSVTMSFGGGGNAVLVGDDIYIFGGHNPMGTFGFGSENTAVRVYNIATKKWTQKSDFLQNLWQNNAAIGEEQSLLDLPASPASIRFEKFTEIRDCLTGSNPVIAGCTIYKSVLSQASATYYNPTNTIYFIGGYMFVEGSGATKTINGKIVNLSEGFVNKIIWEYDITSDTYSAYDYVKVSDSGYVITYPSGPSKDLVSFDLLDNVNSFRARHKAFEYDGTIYITGGVTMEMARRQYCETGRGVFKSKCVAGLVSGLNVRPSSASNFDLLFGYTWTYDPRSKSFNDRAFPGDPQFLFDGENTVDLRSFSQDSFNNRSTAQLYRSADGTKAKIYATIDANNLNRKQSTNYSNCGLVPFCLEDPVTVNGSINSTLYSLDLNTMGAGWTTEPTDNLNLVLGPAFSTIVDVGGEDQFIVMGREMCRNANCLAIDGAASLNASLTEPRGYPYSAGEKIPNFWAKRFVVAEAFVESMDLKIKNAADPSPPTDGPITVNAGANVELHYDTGSYSKCITYKVGFTGNYVLGVNVYTEVGIAESAEFRLSCFNGNTWVHDSVKAYVRTLTIDPSAATIQEGNIVRFSAEYDDGTGAKRILNWKEADWDLAVSPTVNKNKLGDVNGDGIISRPDAFLAFKISGGAEVPTPMQLAAADINDDKVVSSAEVQMINNAVSDFCDGPCLDGKLLVEGIGKGNEIITVTHPATGLSATAQVLVIYNNPPVVDAGASAVIKPGTSHDISTNITDDGSPVPPGKTTYKWTQELGPGTVSFANPAGEVITPQDAVNTDADTSVTFSKSGDYVLRLTADDGEKQGSGTVKIIVMPNDSTLPGQLSVILEARQESTIASDYYDARALIDFNKKVQFQWASEYYNPANPLETLPDIVCRIEGDDGTSYNSLSTSGTGLTTSNALTVKTEYTITCSSASKSLSATDPVLITVGSQPNFAPIVEAGATKTEVLDATGKATVILSDATASDTTLPLGRPLTTKWSDVTSPPLGTPIVFSDPNIVNPTVTFSKKGDYTLKLEATDGDLTASDTVLVQITELNSPPVAYAGADKVYDLVSGAVSVYFGDATISDLTPTGTLTANWRVLSAPDPLGHPAKFISKTVEKPTVTFTKDGTYTLELEASDGSLTDTSTVVITIVQPNSAPVVNAGPTRYRDLDEFGKASIDLSDLSSVSPKPTATDDNKPNPPAALTYQWSTNDKPVGSTVVYSNSTIRLPIITFDKKGTYELRLTADDSLLTGSDIMTVIINPKPDDFILKIHNQYPASLTIDVVKGVGSVTVTDVTNIIVEPITFGFTKDVDLKLEEVSKDGGLSWETKAKNVFGDSFKESIEPDKLKHIRDFGQNNEYEDGSRIQFTITNQAVIANYDAGVSDYIMKIKGEGGGNKIYIEINLHVNITEQGPTET